MENAISIWVVAVFITLYSFLQMGNVVLKNIKKILLREYAFIY